MPASQGGAHLPASAARTASGANFIRLGAESESDWQCAVCKFESSIVAASRPI